MAKNIGVQTELNRDPSGAKKMCLEQSVKCIENGETDTKIRIDHFNINILIPYYKA